MQVTGRAGAGSFKSRVLLVLSTAAIALPLMATTAAAEYRLEIGDVIELAVAGVPDLRQRATVDLDGEVSLPLIGHVKAEGVDISLLRSKVQQLIAAKMLRRTAQDGRELPTIVLPEAVTLAVVEYRPVYLKGDVAKPGEVVFRPGMTVRKAVALVGGYDIMRVRMTNPFFEVADLRSEYDSLWTQFTKEQIVIQRVEAELGNKTTIERKGMIETPLAPSITAKIEGLEVEQLGARTAQHEREKATLQAAIQRTDGQIALLAEQRGNEKEGTDINSEELKRADDLFKKGLIPITRLTEVRRNMLLHSTRVLQTMAQQSQSEKDRDDLTLRLEKIDGQRAVDLLRERQEAEIKLTTIRSRLQAVGEKLAYAGMARSQLVQDGSDAPKIEIFRKSEAGPVRLTVDEDSDLLPGDVVEIALQKNYVVGGVPGQ